MKSGLLSYLWTRNLLKSRVLTEEKLDEIRDSATTNTADDSLTVLEGVFDDRIISRGLWPARSPDLTPCDFYLRGNLKDKFYRTNAHTEEELKESILRGIMEVPQKELLRGNFNLLKRYRACVRVQGHFQHLFIYGKLILLFLWSDT
jgi:hypothetical protein